MRRTSKSRTQISTWRNVTRRVIARDRDLEVEKRLAGHAGAQLEGYIPPCSYSYNTPPDPRETPDMRFSRHAPDSHQRESGGIRLLVPEH
jgi:hypothetical protein